MCGIAGILNLNGAPVDQGVLERMTDVIAHRGPDSAGHWVNGNVGLGHRRLSIIDLSHAADQPMVSGAGSEVIVFNGEIYNYRELAHELELKGLPCRTHSDTEVILNLYRLYGADCVHHLRGMFAFVIWDAVHKRLFAARDRVGIKPLYYLRTDHVFVFGSEIKAIAVSGYSAMKMSLDAFSGFIRFLVVPQPDSIFEDVKKLEPGHFLLIEADGSVRDECYWALMPSPAVEGAYSEDECIAQLSAELKTSVAYHMVSDVPVGAFLSGGLDSSAVVSLMREHAPEQSINAYSIGFPGQEKFDESRYAREVAQLKNITFHSDTITENFIDDLNAMVWHLDEPFAVSSAFATFYLARNAAKTTKVVLTGDGGDELLAGYQGYCNDAYLNKVRTSRFLAPVYQIASALTTFVGANSGAMCRLLAGLRRRSGSEGLRYSEQVAQSSLQAASAVMSGDIFMRCLRSWEHNLMAKYYDHLNTPDRLQKKLYAEFRTRLVDEMLMKVDRMTMAHSLEARVPLLDHRVAEVAFGLPSDIKLRKNSQGNITKYVLKKAMEPYLPHDIIYRRKQGFDIPVDSWLQGRFMGEVKERLMDGYLVNNGIIRRNGVEQLEKLHARSASGNGNMFLILLVLETWVQVYQSRVGNVGVA